MKPDVSKIIDLRRRHSLAEVARLTGININSIKTICSRSGAFRDNPQHRQLFSLPPIVESQSTALAVPTMPEPETITSHFETDAVLCLRKLIKTGDPAAIQMAMEAIKRVKTPLKELGEIYKNHLFQVSGGNPFGTFDAYNFEDLDALARRAIDDAAVRAEAVSRFGDRLFHPTDAENFCIDLLAGIENLDGNNGMPAPRVIKRFVSRPEYMPNTLSDCLREIHYWHQLWWLRRSIDVHGAESRREVTVRSRFVESLLSQIKPRNKGESAAVVEWIAESDFPSLEQDEVKNIVLNLVG